MTDIKQLWTRATPAARSGLVIGVLLIAVLTAVLGRWAVATDYQALFTDLSEQDASTMVAELDRMKVPYRLESGGTRILVPQDMVHKTRLQLVGKNLPLHGAVGFEIFNNTDFGMTEFTQKVNYQRALQGELTRTIMALDEVQAARVHLALPESTLFKRDQNRPKASITLAVKPGRSIGRDQVAGIQRLVAAAVPGIETGDVTVLDQKGVALSRGTEAGAEAAGWQLETKRQVEDHLVRKIGVVLDRAFGPGQGVVSVDAVVNFDQVKVTTEEVLGAKSVGEGAPTGVVVRERQTFKETAARAQEKPEAATAGVTQTDTEFQTGRRIEQLVSTPGSVRRINVGVVVPRGVSQERLDRIRQVVAMAAGLDTQRGDGIAVYSLDQVSDGAPSLKPAAPADAVPALAPATEPVARTDPATPQVKVIGALAAALFVAAAALLFWRSAQRRRAAPPAAALARLPLADTERAALLHSVQQWLEAPASAQQAERRT